MKRALAVGLVVLGAAISGCGKSTPTSPQVVTDRPAYDGGGYMGSGDRVGP
jgi:hypothetical protein